MANASSSRAKNNQNIQVYLRVRPTNERERNIRSQEVVEVSSNRDISVKHVMDTKMTKKFTFDRTFGPESKQSDVYQAVVAPLIEEVLSGYNCTVFAYGQTGTGKTHTMIGEETPKLSSSWDDDSDVGIIPRSLSHLFDELRMMDVEFSMRISYLELYNEELSDLLSSNDSTQIRIFDDVNKKGSIIVQGLEEIPVHSTGDVYKLLAKGQEKRRTASTLMNAASSRSHTIFSILVHIRENGIDGEEFLKIGKLNLVDLAGSENISKAGNNDKLVRTRETVNINQSLLTLGRVITALVERTPHIPYRESKLTRLLQESLGGRTKTSIIATVSPGHKDLDETLSTLEYAHRAKNIQNKPEVNQKLTKRTVLKEYTEEIDRLKRDLMASRDKNGIYLAEETYYDITNRVEEQQRELNEKVILMKALKEELSSKQRLFSEVSLHLVERTKELKTTEKSLSHTKAELGQTKNVLHNTKKRYQEKKHLLESHVKTEQLLSEQANDLITVANAASTDTYRLHDTIERRKTVDQKLATVCEGFTQTMHSRLTGVHGEIDNFNKNIDFHVQSIIDDMNKNYDAHMEYSIESKLKFDHLIEIDLNSKHQLDTYIEESSNVLKQLSVEQKTDFVNMLSVIRNSCVEKERQMKEAYLELSKLAEKQHQQVTMTNLKILNLVNQTKTTNDEFCKNHTSSLNKLATDFVQAMTKNRQKVDDQILSNKKCLQTLKDLYLEVEQKTELLMEISPNLSEITESIVTGLANENEATDQWNTKSNDSSNQTRSTLNQSGETNNEQFELFNAKITATTQSSSDHLSYIEEHLNTSDKKCEATHIELNEKVTEINEKSKEMLIANFVGKTKESTDLKAMVTNETDRLCTFKLGSVAMIKSLNDAIGENNAKTNKLIGECEETIQHFHKNEMKTYASTGDTPSKTEFTYPKVLVSTSPHDRIIRRFWTNFNESSDMDVSNTIYENSESLSLNETNEDAFNDNPESTLLHNGSYEEDAALENNSNATVMQENIGIGLLQDRQNLIVPSTGVISKNTLQSRKNSENFNKENLNN